ncbi:hypothetical protein HG263_19875 [Pseudoalteromonas sp. JBTF-M23]|uniref:Uncharacterized protein n=1 Tax=Pseudoalteromonas caenipelagi TaxID=2726988 RepID=A0A849VIZ4_9GAMM|nr:hypothetical protein [Pseudoalteromonas caenipelagi]NOU52770.1 hypothetical protein [Pseudoalteromonas caenipelagi]
MLKQLIYRLGQQPKLSLKRFLIGLGLFIAAVSAIGYGYYQHPMAQLFGLVLLVPAVFFALWGYIGIFANRFAQIIVTMSPDDKADDNDRIN